MTTFIQYLNEKSEFTPPIKKSFEEIVEWCEINASNYLKIAKESPIFRWMQDLFSTSIIDTTNFKRVSANAFSNIYTIWIDNNPHWSAFPKRSKSLICSSNQHLASDYGQETYRIFPSNSALIGVCPADDLWNSFPLVEKMGLSDLDSFINIISRLLLMCVNYDEREPDYGSLCNALMQCTLSHIKAKGYSSTLAYLNASVGRVYKYMQDNNMKTLYELMSRVIVPKNFVHTTTSNLTIDHNAELWIEGQCAIIPLSYNDDTIDAFYKRLNL